MKPCAHRPGEQDITGGSKTNEEEKVWWMSEMDQHASGPLTHQSNLSLHLTLTHVSELCPEENQQVFQA